ncbi:MAG: hypothetical protein JST14_18215 [Bacteroidetes bacterium]|nr:hypothetical protein [Bacteroidota bacterium]
MSAEASTSERSEKKVLKIAYYWPPSGGSGVQRWLKFVKYLPKLGWTPFVFTPENPSFQIKDDSSDEGCSSGGRGNPLSYLGTV